MFLRSGIWIDAIVLIGLFRVVLDEDGERWVAGLISVAVTAVTTLMGYGLIEEAGMELIPAVSIAAAVCAAVLGVGVANFYGAGFQRASIFAGVFMGVHIARQVAFQAFLT